MKALKLLIVATSFFITGLASATPIGSNGLESYWARWAKFENTDNAAHFIMSVSENSWTSDHSYGIYEVENPANRLDLFSGYTNVSEGSYGTGFATILYDDSDSTLTHQGTGASINTDNRFGFFVSNGDQTIFSDQDLNGGVDYMGAFFQVGRAPDWTFNWEQPGDFVPDAQGSSLFHVSGIYNIAAVPGPAILGIMVFALAVATMLGRRRRN